MPSSKPKLRFGTLQNKTSPKISRILLSATHTRLNIYFLSEQHRVEDPREKIWKAK